MRRFKGNKGLLDKNRFKIWEKEKIRRLKSLSLRRAIKLEESLLSSDFSWAWQEGVFEDHPICLKDSLKKKR